MSTAVPVPGALAADPLGRPNPLGRPGDPARPVAGHLVDALIDDAAALRPGGASIAEGVAAFRRQRAAPQARVVGRFCCPVSGIDQLATELTELTEGDRIRLVLAADTGVAGLAATVTRVGADPRMVLGSVQLPLRPRSDTPGALAAAARQVLPALPDAPAYLEIPLVPRWQEALDVIAAYGCGAALHTGGAEPLPVAELAGFVIACAERGIRFWCTSGLDHAVRQRDPGTGGWQHGLLNVLLAAHAAHTGGAVAAVLAEPDPTALVGLARGLGEPAARATRQLFAGYGADSVPAAVGELTALGLL